MGLSKGCIYIYIGYIGLYRAYIGLKAVEGYKRLNKVEVSFSEGFGK